MDPARHARLAEIFANALGLPAEERGAYVDRTCAGDTALREEVEALLAADAGPTAFLDETPQLPTGAVPRPARIGPYVIEAVIGEGGMGIVYRARQRDPDRVVALKVLRHGVVSPSTIERFEHEKRILARLRHPAIARIYDAGTYEHDGTWQPYFAMELIEGERLTSYARHHDLDLKSRCRLIIRLCEAVEHAHQHGIIHRDLKPANILVQYGDEPRILDFGVARVIGISGMTVQAPQTETGQLVGTLQYMSPEQLRGSSRDLDARADVYALGVLAYELFARSLPYDLSDCSIGEAVRRIEQEVPATLETLVPGARGDLAKIVDTALQKRPDQRYASAEAFAEDLRRFLDDRPIAARPTTAFYRIRKYARRNRAAMIGGVLIVVLLAAAIVGTLSGHARAERERRRLAGLNDLLRATLTSVVPSSGYEGVATVADVLTAAEAALRNLPADDVITRVSVETTIGAAHRGLGDLGAAQRVLENAVEHGSGGGPGAHAVTVEARIELARVYSDQGRAGAAVEIMLPIVDDLEDRLGLDHPKTLDAKNLAGWALFLHGRYDEAGTLFRETLDRRRAVLGPEDASTLLTQTNLVLVLLRTNDLEEAARVADDAVSGYERTIGPKHPTTLYARHVKARALFARGEPEAAAELERSVVDVADEVLGPEHAYTLYWRTALAGDLQSAGDLEEAEREAQIAVDARRSLVGGGPGTLVESLNVLNRIQCDRGRFVQAEAAAREAYRIAAEMSPPSPRLLWWAELGIALAIAGQGSVDEGRAIIERIARDMENGGATQQEVARMRERIAKLGQPR